jgi:FkbM family methyltransferase
MRIADYLYRFKKGLYKLDKLAEVPRQRRHRKELRRRADAFRYLQSKNARIYKQIDGISLVQYPDHIAGKLVEGTLWGLKDFQSALADLRPRLRSGAFIDFGANSGMVSIYAARENRFEKIIAIEPLQANFALLCANLRLNDVGNALPIQCAVSDREGEARMPVTLALGASGFDFESDQSELVRMRRLDNLLEEIGIDAASVALIWISVRGHENAALGGMTKLLAAQVPLVIYFCPFSEPAATIGILQRHYQHCASRKSGGPQPIASLQPEKFNKTPGSPSGTATRLGSQLLL